MADNYTVTSQTQTVQLTPQGTFRDVMEVTFDVPGVGSGTVRVPLDLYNADTVKAAIEQQVEHMTNVANL